MILCCCIIVCLMILLYLFLIAPNPRGRRRCQPFFGRMYAHRGLHDGNHAVPENSMAAFRLAVEAGYGIELDVRLTREGCLAVHHDPTLLRLCGRDQRVRDLTMEELAACRLAGTEEGVPAFSDVLAMVNGRVPLIIEVKNEKIGETLTAETAWACLQNYAGPFCVESFDPMTVRWFKKHAPQVVRGQLAHDPWRKGEGRKTPRWQKLSAYLLMNCLSRPDFIAYDLQSDGNPSFRLVRRLFHPGLAAWTVRTEEALAKGKASYDLLIFEAIRP